MKEKLIVFLWFLILAITDLCRAAELHDFTYDNACEWNAQFVEYCAGELQSPISLRRDEARTCSNAPKLKFRHYDVPLGAPIIAENNGHTINVIVGKAINGFRPSVSGGGVNDTYEVQGLHFHWGSPHSTGSEHEIDDTKYDVEMHIVHKNTKYATLAEASKDPSGILVLGIMLKRTKLPTLGLSLRPIYDSIPYLSKYKSKFEINDTITMDSILSGINTKEFFTYKGSITIPPCSEAVNWFVFPDVIPIQVQHLKLFWGVCDSKNYPLINNFRPIQPVNDRMVFYRSSRKEC